MSSNTEIGSSSRITKRYRTLYALLHPEFSVRDTGFLAHGTNNIKKHYSLNDGGCLKFFYAGNDKFVMKVEDRLLREVKYPNPPKVYEVDLEVYNNFIWIDESETEEEVQNLPAEMVKQALFIKPVKCTLKDDSDRIYPCNIRWVYRRKTEAISPKDGNIFAPITIYMREVGWSCLLSLMSRANSVRRKKMFSNSWWKKSLFCFLVSIKIATSSLFWIFENSP